MTTIAPPRTFAEAQLQLATSLPGYEEREQQTALAVRVEALMERAAAHAAVAHQEGAPEPMHLWGQAGTGTGKSLAYLIPAILSGRRTIVSVTTRALQSQLANKDLPFLEAHLGVPFVWAQLQGRSRYFCSHRAESVDTADCPSLPLMQKALAGGWDGLRESLPVEVYDREWARVNADAEDCKANGCRDAYREGDTGCRAEHARAEAQKATIVVVNHALLCTDLVIRAQEGPGMLGEYEAVVIDEAHELEDVAGDSIGAQITEGSFRALTAELRVWVSRYSEEEIDGPLSQVMATVADLFEALPEGRIRSATLSEYADVFRGLVEAVVDLGEEWARVSKDLDSVPGPLYRKAVGRRDTLTRRLRRLTERYFEVIEADFDDLVRWVEFETTSRGERRKVMRTAPVSVAPFLHATLFSRVPCALVSATLAVGGSKSDPRTRFTYMAGRLGVGEADAIDVGTPFDYPSQARLYVPVHLPEPARGQVEQWEAQSAEEILELIRAAEGRALVLFTSTAHLRRAAEQIRRRIPHTVLVQGEAPVSKLAEQFIADEHSVLFGTRSFMTGFDPRGRTCSLVIVSKMPFPVPTEPLTEARCEAIKDRGGSDFNEYTKPVMSLVLQQAAGRLIRHRDDRGVVAILDPRIVSKGYGKDILRDLPPMPLVKRLEEAGAFLAEHLAVAGA
jgi:ATP-dependent DNA helicase DinG